MRNKEETMDLTVEYDTLAVNQSMVSEYSCQLKTIS